MKDITTVTPEQLKKYEALKAYLKDLGSAAVSFSGGVDSTFLLCVAREVLGDDVVAVTANSEFFPVRERDEAAAFCAERGIRHIRFEAAVLNVEGVAENPKNRCYLCKKALFTRIIEIQRELGLAAVLEGSNVADDVDYRPGKQAVLELGVRSPLRGCGLTKADIRALSRHLGLPTWDKPSYACLASRIPYGDRITPETLSRVDRAEQLLISLGFRQMRVRVHGNVARIELEPEQFDAFMRREVRTEVDAALRGMGFAYVTLDLRGFRSGSLNDGIVSSRA